MKLTMTAGALRAGDRIGRAVVRYSTPTDTCSAYLVYVQGEATPRRYGLNEPITVTRDPRPAG